MFTPFIRHPAQAGVHDALRSCRNPGMKQPCVCILASEKNGTLYTGVTSNLTQRVWRHRNDLIEGFTKRYGVHQLVFFELRATMDAAILREKRIKRWRRAWKIRLIEEKNSEWQDLSDQIA